MFSGSSTASKKMVQQLMRRLFLHGGPKKEVGPVFGLDMSIGGLGPLGNDLLDR